MVSCSQPRTLSANIPASQKMTLPLIFISYSVKPLAKSQYWFDYKWAQLMRLHDRLNFISTVRRPKLLQCPKNTWRSLALSLSGSYFVVFFITSETTFSTSFLMSLLLDSTKKVVFLPCIIGIFVQLVPAFQALDFNYCWPNIYCFLFRCSIQ